MDEHNDNGVHLLKEQDEIRRIHLEELCREIAIGTAQSERGEVTAYASGKVFADKIKAEGRKRMAERKQAGI